MLDKKKEEKISLLKEAFNDTKTIINNLDTKARFLLAVNLAFIAGILMIMRILMNNDFLIFKQYVLIPLMVYGTGIIIYDLYIIYLLITKVINPRNNPTDKIKNQKNFLNDSIFFPIPEKDDTFDYLLYLEKYNRIHNIEKIYLFELLKISYIRHLKIKALNKIILKFEKLIIHLINYIGITCLIMVLFILIFKK